MFAVYVLKSTITAKTYVGSTDNLVRRLKEHNSGKHSFTRRYKPWLVIYTEEYGDEYLARMREKFFKTRQGRRKLKAIFNEHSGIV